MIIAAKSTHTASIILYPTHPQTNRSLHGLGDSGAGWTSFARDMQGSLPHIKWILPDAYLYTFPRNTSPMQAVTLNNGYAMRSWYDITSLDRNANHDEPGILASTARVNSLIDSEVKSGIPYNRILLAGFSQGSSAHPLVMQGAVVTLATAYAHPQKLAGILALSGYLPYPQSFRTRLSPANIDTKMLWCHGTDDQVVSFHWGVEGFDKIKGMVSACEFKRYEGLGHGLGDVEHRDILAFLKERLA